MTLPLNPRPDELMARYRELLTYVGLTSDDIRLVPRVWPLVEPSLHELVDDFYEEILRHAEPRQVFSGPDQVRRLKASLRHWIAELFAAEHDESFVIKRWQVGFRHVQIGLQPIWVSAAMSRLREKTLQIVRSHWSPDDLLLFPTSSAIARLMDLDLALIQDAYNAESVAERLGHERNFAEGVIQTAQAVVMVVDHQGNLVRGNAFLSALLGWDEQPPQQQTALFDLVAPHDQAPLQTFLTTAAAGDSPTPLDTELRPLGRPPRRVRWLGKQYHPHGGSNATNNQPLILCVGQDITDLTEAQRQLVRQERLAAIGQTMTGLAHESRNAFQRSQAALETLTLELEDRPAAVELIERIQRAHDHLLHLYEEVLQFARPVHLELQQVHLESLTRQTWEHLAAVRSSKPIQLNISGTAPPLIADPFAIEQILRNLLENAIHASDTASQVDVLFSAAWIGARPALCATIRDFGKGIPAPYRERIFEPFFTTRSRGTGLGLPIARRLAEGHGGSLHLEPADPGTTAILVLPLTAVPDPEVNLLHEDPRRP